MAKLSTKNGINAFVHDHSDYSGPRYTKDLVCVNQCEGKILQFIQIVRALHEFSILSLVSR